MLKKIHLDMDKQVFSVELRQNWAQSILEPNHSERQKIQS